MRTKEAVVKYMSLRNSTQEFAVNEPTPNYSRTYHSNNKKDFTELYDLLYNFVYLFACRFVNKEDAADVTADAFYRFYQKGIEFKNLQVAKSYLQISVRNACLNLIGVKKIKSKSESELSYLANDAADEQREL